MQITMKTLLFLPIILHLNLEQNTSVSKFGSSIAFFNVENNDLLVVDSLRLDSLKFCPSQEIIDLLGEVSKCCCVKGDCIQTISLSGIEVVNKGIEMVLEDYKMSGSCWSYASKVYELAGFPSNKRTTIYKSNKGTWIKDPSIIQPGDWIYHVNYSFHNVEHSAIFICWKDYDRRIAITLSHVGQKKYAPGKFGEYDLSGVYNVIRGF